MIKIVIDIDGMMCGMCESHINDAIRQNFNVKKVKSSHTKGQTEIIAENDIEEDICRKVKNKTSEKDDCYGDDYDMCKDCVIEFYTKKVRDKE